MQTQFNSHHLEVLVILFAQRKAAKIWLILFPLCAEHKTNFALRMASFTVPIFDSFLLSHFWKDGCLGGTSKLRQVTSRRSILVSTRKMIGMPGPCVTDRCRIDIWASILFQFASHSTKFFLQFFSPCRIRFPPHS